jgi:hypothetical protein
MRRWLLNNSNPRKKPGKNFCAYELISRWPQGKFDMAAAVANNLVEVEPENSSFRANRSRSNLPLSVQFFTNGGVTPE